MKKNALGWVLVWMVLVASVAIVRCTRSEQGSTQVRAKRVINLAIWSNFLSPEVLQNFQEKTGIQVVVSHYSSNEELLAKLQAGATGYDLIVPSDYMVFAMVQLGLLQKLDRARLTHFDSLDPKFLGKKFDPRNEFSVPYDWGTTGIAVHTGLYNGPPIRGWKDLFERPELAGKMTLLDDVRETLGAALKSKGYSLNSTNTQELEQAKAILMQAKKRVKGFTSEPLMSLVQGEVAVAHIYMSDALQAGRKTGGKVKYIVPSEGATLWIDNLCIPASSQHVAEAHELIQYLLEPQVSAATVTSILVGPANLKTAGLLPLEIRRNPDLFPGPEVMKRLEMIQDLGPALKAWDRIWTEVKAL